MKEIKALVLSILVGLMIIQCLHFVNAYESVPQNQNYTLVVSSNNATSCNLTYIKIGNTNTIVNLEMTKSGQDFYLVIDRGNYSSLTDICLGITCTNGVNFESGNECRTITTSGQKLSLSNTIIVIVFLIISILCFILGYSFDKERFLLKTSFYLFSLLLGLLAVNSARIIVSESTNLNIMGTVGLVLMIAVICFMFLYMFIIWTVNTFKQIKDKKELRWQY